MAVPVPDASPGPGRASAAMPTARTLFLRTFIPWQLVRFAWINLRMLRIIWRSHH